MIAAIRKRLSIGWWSISLRLYGYESINEAAASLIQAQFAKKTQQAMTVTRWNQGMPMNPSPA